MTLPRLLLTTLVLLAGCKSGPDADERDKQLRNCWALNVPPGRPAKFDESAEVQRCLIERYDWDTDSTLSPVLDRNIELRKEDSLRTR